MENYTFSDNIGEGAFGEVIKAKHLLSGKTVAIKKIHLNGDGESIPNTTLREIRALQQIDHPNIMKLYDVFASGTCIALVLEYLEVDLYSFLEQQRNPLPLAIIKSILLMLVKGIDYCHKNHIIHRDLKPSNILFSSNGMLKIGDFGLARVYNNNSNSNNNNNNNTYTPQVATKWYRSPELLYGSCRYSNAVDMWAIGCIMYELFTFNVLFPGQNDINQLSRVIQVLGTPNLKEWAEIVDLPDYNKIFFPKLQPLSIHTLIPSGNKESIDLLQKFLIYNPSKRISASEALQHPFFVNDPLPCDYCCLVPYIKNIKRNFKNDYNNKIQTKYLL